MTQGPAPDQSQVADLAVADDLAFERLLHFLKESRAFDFTGYKRPSLRRRVQQRMSEVGVDDFEAYQDLLQLEPEEFTQLFNTILINVTSFFRDLEAWDYLRDAVLPELLRATGDGPVRVWSAGAASGQEAYSLAMLLHDVMGSQFRERVKIYATDVDEEALNHARQAAYGEREVAGVPSGYRERYLDRIAGRLVVTSDLRRNVIFGRNDLIKDAPISRIDILMCRNTLMYFNAETQSRVVNRLGFALRPRGILFLGKAEMLLNHTEVFEAVDLKRRFFRRIASAPVEGAALGPAHRRRPSPTVEAADGQLRNEILLANPIPQIAVAADGRLALVNHRAAAMLGVSDRDVGRPFQDLDLSYRPLELRSHLAQVIGSRTPLLLREVEWRRPGVDPLFLDVQLVPVADPGGEVGGVSVSFLDVTRARQLRQEVEETNRQLEVAYEELQSTNEELETTNEELQSTVEELETTNEELQSTNEELETMNEELQSANDEMQSTNDQLRDRTAEVGELNDFMHSILSSLDPAVIVVDAALTVQVWTPQAYELWGLRADEAVGHHLLNLDSGLPATSLHPWLRSVITAQSPAVVGQEVAAVNRRGRSVTLRVTVTALHVGGAKPTGALVLMEDVTEPPGGDQRPTD